MKNIETPLTWGLGILGLVLILLSSLNTTSTNFNISDVKSDANNGFDLNHDHDIQEATVYSVGDWGKNSCSSSFTIKDPNMGIAAMAEGLSDTNIFVRKLEDGEVLIDTLILEELAEDDTKE